MWFSDANQLLWSDIPNQRMLRWTPEGGVSVYRQPSDFANGHTRDRQGRLVSCEHGSRRVTRTQYDGTITVLADSFEGRRLNSPGGRGTVSACAWRSGRRRRQQRGTRA